MKYLNVKDLQKIMPIGRDKAYALMRSSVFPSVKIGGQYLVSEVALEEWEKQYRCKMYTL